MRRRGAVSFQDLLRLARDLVVNHPAVAAALKEVGYRGSATLEMASGDEAYLRDVSKRFDSILAL